MPLLLLSVAKSFATNAGRDAARADETRGPALCLHYRALIAGRVPANGSAEIAAAWLSGYDSERSRLADAEIFAAMP